MKKIIDSIKSSIKDRLEACSNFFVCLIVGPIFLIWCMLHPDQVEPPVDIKEEDLDFDIILRDHKYIR